MNRFEQNYADNIVLGEKSYGAVVNKIYQTILHAQAETIEGSEFLSKIYSELNESNTPLLTLKPFVTNAEELAQTDKTVGQVISIIKKSINGNADLNFLINMCKEEHFQNMNRAGVPDPEQTIKSIKDKFNKTSNETIKMISEGIFDCLESSLLGSIKKDLGFSENETTTSKSAITDLKESQVFLNNDIVSYSPVGFIFKSMDGTNYGFMEGSFVRIHQNDGDEGVNEMELVDKEQVPDILEKHLKLMRAVEECVYNPETNEFETSQSWDFNPRINSDGVIVITLPDGKDKEVDKKDIQKLFIETLNEYERNPMLNEKYNKTLKNQYIRDADNFCNIAFNHKALVRFNNITTVRKLNESSPDTVILFENNPNNPRLIKKGFDKNIRYDSFMDLCEDCENMIGMPNIFKNIFESSLNEEQEILKFRRNRLVELNEQQKQINADLTSIRQMKSVAEENSPAMQELNEREQKLDRSLKRNIDETAELRQMKLY